MKQTETPEPNKPSYTQAVGILTQVIQKSPNVTPELWETQVKPALALIQTGAKILDDIQEELPTPPQTGSALDRLDEKEPVVKPKKRVKQSR